MLMATLDRLVRITHKQRQTAHKIAAPKAHQRIARHHNPSAGHKGGSRPSRKGFRLFLGEAQRAGAQKLTRPDGEIRDNGQRWTRVDTSCPISTGDIAC
jgi:hypothetical protein